MSRLQSTIILISVITCQLIVTNIHISDENKQIQRKLDKIIKELKFQKTIKNKIRCQKIN